jgi:hypothetical protein
MKTKTTYPAGRQSEEPGITFQAATVSAAKAYVSRHLEGGAFQGQRITLTELTDDGDGGFIRTDRIWHKAAHSRKWVARGDAA